MGEDKLRSAEITSSQTVNAEIADAVGIPALTALWRLEEAGFEAWIVGGCLRDYLLGRDCHDVDIATSALPQQIQTAFSHCPQAETGIAHGTVLAVVEGQPLEITTYRREGEYKDHRRPCEVEFTSHLKEDLARRDFTVNAMAWNPKCGLADPFGGRHDLHEKILRCVGEPRQRFREDALRILRGLRFSAAYELKIEEETESAMEAEQKWLSLLSGERIWSELKRTLACSGAGRSMERYGGLWRAALKEFPEVGARELSWIAALRFEGEELPLLRLALLLKGDLKRTKGLAAQAKMSRSEERILTEAAESWNCRIPAGMGDGAEDCGSAEDAEEGSAAESRMAGRWKRWIYADGYDTVLRTVALRNARSADCHRYDEWLRRVEDWRRDGECVSVAQLAVDGDALMERGVPGGARIGALLKQALFGVMDGQTANERQSLLQYLNL